ncbi:hypothetical protein LVJ94_39095 [Pendulispora rubella]|uniref:Uncharacterized protein n=1 Tax=Pendulispora rubella TaxID=2741070 RepID=A0ABZ2KW49_9BACT
MKATYFFQGNMPYETNLHTVRSSNPSQDYWWTKTPSSRPATMKSIKDTGINVLTAPYLGKYVTSGHFSDSTQVAFGYLIKEAKDAGLLILPALEGTQNCVDGPPTNQYGTETGDWRNTCPTRAVTTFDQQNVIANPTAFIERIEELFVLFGDRLESTWARIYDRDGKARYAIHINHPSQLYKPGQTDVDVANAFEGIRRAFAAKGKDIGFMFDTWQENKPGGFIDLKPNSPVTKTTGFLALQGFGTEILSFGIAKEYGCADPANRIHHEIVNGEHRYSVYANENDVVMKRIADEKKAALSSWVASGVPVHLDVSPGYDATKVFGQPHLDCSKPWEINVMFGDTGRTSSPVFDRWRNAQSEFKGHGIKGIMFNSWNGYTEGMVAEDTIEHGSVERRWLTDLLRADPRLCDHYYYENGVQKYHVFGAICMKFGDLDRGGEYGVLGQPTGDAVPGASKYPNLVYQPFTKGRIYWDGSAAREVHGAIHDKFRAMRYEEGYGYPTTDQEKLGPVPDGAYNDFFGGGSIYYSHSGTYAVWGAINDTYKTIRNSDRCGAPTSDEKPYGADGAIVYMEKGSIQWFPGVGSTIHCP